MMCRYQQVPRTQYLISLHVLYSITLTQGWDKYCLAGKFQSKMLDNTGRANTPKITEVANTGTYEQN